MKLCFLSSSNGGNFKFFHLAQEKGILRNIELSLIADRDCRALEYAIENGIKHKRIKYRRDYNEELLNTLEEVEPDIIVTTWNKIIDNYTVTKFQGKLINLHYSLLPAFAGLIGTEPIVKAYERNCQFIGVTCHYVDEGVDTGKIISQAVIKKDVPIELAIPRIFRMGCLILLNSILLITNEDLIERRNNSKFNYSPSLLFNDEIFDEKFWKELEVL